MTKTRWTPGPHWTDQFVSDAGWMGERFSDAEACFKVALLTRQQLDHEGVCQLGRDRIRMLSRRVHELTEALAKIEGALCKDSRQKTISGDTVEYHLDGQAMYAAINSARAALARALGEPK